MKESSGWLVVRSVIGVHATEIQVREADRYFVPKTQMVTK